MKTAIVVYQDAADGPLEALDGRTLLETARAPTASRLANQGCTGWYPGPAAGHALLAEVCGLPPEKAGRLCRGPVEAWLLDRPPAPGDLVYHVDLVTEDQGVICSIPRPRLHETQELAGALSQGLDPARARFACIGGGSLLLMLTGLPDGLPAGIPTRQVLNQHRADVTPDRRDTAPLREIMDQAAQILARHPVNDIRLDLGEDPANGLWLHGGGRWPDAAASTQPNPQMTLLTDSLPGLGIARMLQVPSLPLRYPSDGDGAWFHMPDLVAALYAHDALVVEVHVPTSADPVDRVRDLDRIDRGLLLPLVELMSRLRPYRIALIAGSTEPSTHKSTLPVLVAGDDLLPDSPSRWDENSCTSGGLGRVNLASLAHQLQSPV